MRPSQPKEVPGSSSYTDTLPVRRGCDCVFKKQFQGPIVELDGILMDEGDPCLLKPSVNTISSVRNICLPKYWITAYLLKNITKQFTNS